MWKLPGSKIKWRGMEQKERERGEGKGGKGERGAGRGVEKRRKEREEGKGGERIDGAPGTKDRFSSTRNWLCELK
jgi:hypothetical protein